MLYSEGSGDNSLSCRRARCIAIVNYNNKMDRSESYTMCVGEFLILKVVYLGKTKVRRKTRGKYPEDFPTSLLQQEDSLAIWTFSLPSTVKGKRLAAAGGSQRACARRAKPLAL